MALKCPEFAVQMRERMKTRGRYAKGWPLGAVIHFTAGRDGAERTIRGGIKDGFTYWCIQRDGKLFCAHNADEWGWHAGESKWKTLFGAVSDDLIGIEINAAGRLRRLENGTFRPWYNEADYLRKFRRAPDVRDDFLAKDVRYCDGSSPDQLKGYYHKYTAEQEETLVKTLLWLKLERPDVFSFDRVLGHSEVSGKLGIGFWRKNDPSAALSTTMPEFRNALSSLYEGMI